MKKIILLVGIAALSGCRGIDFYSYSHHSLLTFKNCPNVLQDAVAYRLYKKDPVGYSTYINGTPSEKAEIEKKVKAELLELADYFGKHDDSHTIKVSITLGDFDVKTGMFELLNVPQHLRKGSWMSQNVYYYTSNEASTKYAHSIHGYGFDYREQKIPGGTDKILTPKGNAQFSVNNTEIKRRFDSVTKIIDGKYYLVLPKETANELAKEIARYDPYVHKKSESTFKLQLTTSGTPDGTCFGKKPVLKVTDSIDIELKEQYYSKVSRSNLNTNYYTFPE